MISVSQCTMQFNGIPLFDAISFSVGDRDKIGLVGRNGAGKSTLLQILNGDITPETGSIITSKQHTIGFLKQQLEVEYTSSVKEECRIAFESVIQLESDIEHIQQKINNSTDYQSTEYIDLCEQLANLYHRLDISGGNTLEARIEKILLGLGFTHDSMHGSASELSGGWQMRLELAKLLLRNPDTLLLDEPTNHLDIDSIRWLESYLAVYEGAVILVSHDKVFLDTVTKRTIEIRNAKIEDYPCTYSAYVKERLIREDHKLKAYQSQQKEIEKTQEFIDRFRSKANLASRVQSRIKQLDAKERIVLDDYKEKAIAFSFPPSPRAPRLLFHSSNLSKSYDNRIILEGITFDIEREQKCAFIGRNGEGKSTLSRILAGIESYDGNLIVSDGLKIGYYAQHHADSLDPTKTVFETLDHVAVGDIRTKIRSILGAFLFSGDSVDKKVRVLSGGERARLALAMLLLHESHVLILDEPTNHLDMSAKDILKSALMNYNGALIVVSHDRDFLDGLTDNIYHFSKKKVKHYPFNIHEFLSKHAVESIDDLIVQTPSTVNDTSDVKQSRDIKKSVEREERKRLKIIEKIESDISQKEEMLKLIDGELGEDGIYKQPYRIEELNIKRNQLQEELGQLLQQWEDIQSD